MIYITILLSLALLYLTYAVQQGKEVTLAIINGFMIGFLYDVEEVEDENWHTVQILLGILSINILWESSTR
jgi:hypothetical protein